MKFLLHFSQQWGEKWNNFPIYEKKFFKFHYSSFSRQQLERNRQEIYASERVTTKATEGYEIFREWEILIENGKDFHERKENHRWETNISLLISPSSWR